MLSRVGDIADGAMFITSATRRCGTILEHDQHGRDRSVRVILDPLPGKVEFEEKLLHPQVRVIPAEAQVA